VADIPYYSDDPETNVNPTSGASRYSRSSISSHPRYRYRPPSQSQSRAPKLTYRQQQRLEAEEAERANKARYAAKAKEAARQAEIAERERAAKAASQASALAKQKAEQEARKAAAQAAAKAREQERRARAIAAEKAIAAKAEAERKAYAEALAESIRVQEEAAAHWRASVAEAKRKEKLQEIARQQAAQAKALEQAKAREKAAKQKAQAEARAREEARRKKALAAEAALKAKSAEEQRLAAIRAEQARKRMESAARSFAEAKKKADAEAAEKKRKEEESARLRSHQKALLEAQAKEEARKKAAQEEAKEREEARRKKALAKEKEIAALPPAERDRINKITEEKQRGMEEAAKPFVDARKKAEADAAAAEKKRQEEEMAKLGPKQRAIIEARNREEDRKKVAQEEAKERERARRKKAVDKELEIAALPTEEKEKIYRATEEKKRRMEEAARSWMEFRKTEEGHKLAPIKKDSDLPGYPDDALEKPEGIPDYLWPYDPLAPTGGYIWDQYPETYGKYRPANPRDDRDMADIPEYPISPDNPDGIPDYLWPYDPLAPTGGSIYDQYPGSFKKGQPYTPPVKFGRPTSPRVTRTSDGYAGRDTLNNTTVQAVETQVTVSADSRPLKICFGNVSIGGEIIWIGTHDDKWLVHIRWCLGEIGAINEIRLNDKVVETGIEINSYTGTTTQLVDPWLAAAISGFDDKLVMTLDGESVGIAYSVIRIEYDVMPDSLNFTANIDGLKCRNPADGSMVSNDNPGVHLYEFFRSGKFGPKWDTDDANFGALVNFCDQNVDGEKRKRSGMVMESQRPLRDWIVTMTSAAGAFLRVDKEKIKPRRAWTDGTSFSLDMERDIRKGSFRAAPIIKVNAPNVIRVLYTNTTVIPWASDVEVYETTAVKNGTEPRLVSQFSMPWIQSAKQAYREAVQIYRSGLYSTFNFSWVGKDSQMMIERGDLASISNIPNMSGTYVVRILSNDLVEIEGMYLPKIIGRVYDAREYADTSHTPIPRGNPNLPSPAVIDPPTSVNTSEEVWKGKSGSRSSCIEISWVGVNHPYSSSYRIQVTSNSGTKVWENLALQHIGAGVEHKIRTGPLDLDSPFLCTVFSISTVGTQSANGSSSSISLNGSVQPPANVGSISITEYWDRVGVSWTNILAHTDYGYRVRRGSSTDTWESATQLDEDVPLETNRPVNGQIFYYDVDVPAGSARYFVKGIDKEGDESSQASYEDVSIKEPKGSFFLETPRVPTSELQKPTDVIVIPHEYKPYTYVSGLYTGTWKYFSFDTTTEGWVTAFERSGSPGFIGFGLLASRVRVTLTRRTAIRIKMSIDGKGVISFDYVLDQNTALLNEVGLNIIGAILPDLGPAPNDIVGVWQDYIPWSNSIKIEVYRDDPDKTYQRFVYWENEIIKEFPVSRPAPIKGFGQPIITTAKASLYDHFVDGLSTSGANLNLHYKQIDDSQGNYIPVVDIENKPGVLQLFIITVDNQVGVAKTVTVRYTVDDDPAKTWIVNLVSGNLRYYSLCGNITFRLDNSVGDIVLDHFPFSKKMKLEINNGSHGGQFKVRVAYSVLET